MPVIPFTPLGDLPSDAFPLLNAHWRDYVRIFTGPNP